MKVGAFVQQNPDVSVLVAGDRDGKYDGVYQVLALLQQAGVAAAVVADNKYLSEEDLHLKVRDYFVYRNHPEVGTRQHAGVPWKMSRTETVVRSAAPTIGQHNDEVLTGLLGYSKEDVAALRAAGATAPSSCSTLPPRCGAPSWSGRLQQSSARWTGVALQLSGYKYL